MTCQKHMSRIDADDAPAPPSVMLTLRKHTSSRHVQLCLHRTSCFIRLHLIVRCYLPIISAMLTATAISSTCVHTIELAVHGTIRTHHRGIWMACVVVMRLSARVSIVFLMHFDGRHGTRAVP